MVYYFLSPDESSGACGLLAQLVEHIVHIDGVTGSSPVQTTQSSICKGRGFFHIAAEKEGVKHDPVYPPHQAQQESPQRTGRQEAHNMGVFPGDEESREQENLQPQESRSCVEGRFQHERFLLHWGWYRGERRPWQHLNHVTGLQGGSTEPACRIFCLSGI